MSISDLKSPNVKSQQITDLKKDEHLQMCKHIAEEPDHL